MDLRDSYARQVRLLMTALPHVAQESCFALKGGTAINLFVQDFPRLSVDIDLAYKTFTDRDTDLAVINDALMCITESLNGRPGITAIRQENKADEKRIIVNTADAKIKIEVCHTVKCGPRTLCVEFHPLYVNLRPLCVDLTPHITKPLSLNTDFS